MFGSAEKPSQNINGNEFIIFIQYLKRISIKLISVYFYTIEIRRNEIIYKL